MIGQTVSRYRIIEELGAGAMGEIYRAADSNLHLFSTVVPITANFRGSMGGER